MIKDDRDPGRIVRPFKVGPAAGKAPTDLWTNCDWLIAHISGGEWDKAEQDLDSLSHFVTSARQYVAEQKWRRHCEVENGMGQSERLAVSGPPADTQGREDALCDTERGRKASNQGRGGRGNLDPQPEAPTAEGETA